MDTTENKKESKFVCRTCASDSAGTPGNCCGAERSKVCEMCDHLHKEDGTCDCGCK